VRAPPLQSAKRGSSVACLFLFARSIVVSIAQLAPVLIAAVPRPLAAQEPNPPPAISELPEITISATATPEPVAEIGSSVTVIDSAQIEREQRRTAPDVLSLVPGLNIVQTGGPGGTTSVFIRGTNPNQIKVLIDGIDASDPSNPNGS
jgi:vitamin B12 transporter